MVTESELSKLYLKSGNVISSIDHKVESIKYIKNDDRKEYIVEYDNGMLLRFDDWEVKFYIYKDCRHCEFENNESKIPILSSYKVFKGDRLNYVTTIVREQKNKSVKYYLENYMRDELYGDEKVLLARRKIKSCPMCHGILEDK